MRIFTYARSHPSEILAITDAGEEMRYAEMNGLADLLREKIGHRLVFVLCRNTPGSLLGYLALLEAGCVPLLLDADTAPALLEDLVRTYRPAFCLVPEDLSEEPLSALREVLRIRDYRLLCCAPEGTDPPLAHELRLLLPTSGSTGSSKLVRISAQNLDANAASIVEYLRITKEDRPVTVLPMQYSYGMSILHTHVCVGAPILLTRRTILERGFWERVRREGATSLCGVPYTFEMYARVGLMDMDLPALRTVTQAGGKLPEKRQLQFAEWAAKRGIRFYVMYGQTEASPRMAWLPPEKAVEKCGSMGIAIPGGKLELVDENGAVILPETGGSVREESGLIAGRDGQGKVSLGEKLREEAGPEKRYGDAVGELVYTGRNVALGYALCAEDLRKGDEFHGVLHTGDMARRDADGFFYIVGRRSRFIKIAGKRIGLDEAEKILRARFPDLELACAGRDEQLRVFVEAGTAFPGSFQGGYGHGTLEKESAELEGDKAGISPLPEDGRAVMQEQPSREVLSEDALSEDISGFLEEMTGIPQSRICVTILPELPRSSSGKIRYAQLSG